MDIDIPVFSKIQLWRDANHNGVSEPAELRPADVELSGIGLGYSPDRRTDSHGNQSRFGGFVHVRRAAGRNRPSSANEDRVRSRPMYDVCLVTR